MTTPDPLDAAIAASHDAFWDTLATGDANYDDARAAAIRAAAPILIAAGHELGYVDGHADGMHDGREQAAKDIVGAVHEAVIGKSPDIYEAGIAEGLDRAVHVARGGAP